MSARWTADDMPNLSGHVMVVTGANSGLGLETTRALASHGAHVIMACRSLDKAHRAIEQLRTQGAGEVEGRLEPWALDLASLDSIEQFAARFESEHEQLHALCNNAGVMALPYGRTADGFEMQLGTNHLGHFALTGRLLSVLMETAGSRVVTVSSLMHRMGRMRWDDLHGEQRYRKWPAYGQSKLANLLFTFELQRRLEAAKARTIAVASHPGYCSTNLVLAGQQRGRSSLRTRVVDGFTRMAAQSAEQGALPSLYALTADDVRGGEYFGPSGPMESWGLPTRVQASARARNVEDAARLWAVSQQMTGVRYDALSN